MSYAGDIVYGTLEEAERLAVRFLPMEATMNVYVVDAQGRVHDVAYDQEASVAKAMAKSIEGGVAALERPAEKKPAKSAE